MMASNVLTDNLSAPLNGATSVKVEIESDIGNLTIDRLTDGEQVLASGTLQYMENQDPPTRTLDSIDGKTVLAVRGQGTARSWFRFPWDACNGATEWQIHLNPMVSSDIHAHSGGGNVKLNLAGMAVTRVMADAGGGNMDVVLPDDAASLGAIAKTGAGNVTVDLGRGIKGSNTVEAKSGAGNIVVRVPRGTVARVHASSGFGKVIVDSQFSQMDGDTYQSPDYDVAADKVEITVHSGAGNVSVDTK
jgi:hypothetical protein